MKKIVFDARMFGLEHAGIGRYISNLLREIKDVSFAKQYSFSLLVRKDKLSAVKKELGDFYHYQPVVAPHYSFQEQREILSKIHALSPQLVHFPHFNLPFFFKGRYVVTIHDLIKHFFRGRKTTTRSPALYWLKYWGYRLLIRKAVGGAAAVIVPTYWWQKKLAAIYRLPKKKIFVTWEGVDSSFLNCPSLSGAKVLARYGLQPKRFFIYTGSVYPHKNVQRLIEAFLKMKRKDLVLVIVCSRNIFVRRLAKMTSSSQIRFLGFVSDQELKALYQQAIALVQPSLMEGFGLTGLEAMACGCPVISSSASCLPEVYGKAACYFNPLKVEEIKEKLVLLASNERIRQQLIKRGQARWPLFSWRKTARETLKVYEKVLGDEKA